MRTSSSLFAPQPVALLAQDPSRPSLRAARETVSRRCISTCSLLCRAYALVHYALWVKNRVTFVRSTVQKFITVLSADGVHTLWPTSTRPSLSQSANLDPQLAQICRLVIN